MPGAAAENGATAGQASLLWQRADSLERDPDSEEIEAPAVLALIPYRCLVVAPVVDRPWFQKPPRGGRGPPHPADGGAPQSHGAAPSPHGAPRKPLKASGGRGPKSPGPPRPRKSPGPSGGTRNTQVRALIVRMRPQRWQFACALCVQLCGGQRRQPAPQQTYPPTPVTGVQRCARRTSTQ
jgi:hypothetical protein